MSAGFDERLMVVSEQQWVWEEPWIAAGGA